MTLRAVGRRPTLVISCIAVMAVGIVWRLLLAITHKGFDTGDQLAYSALATALADDLRYSIPLAQDRFHWAPGAPSLFAVGLRIFGRGDSDLAGAYTIQALLSIAAIPALYFACRHLAGNTSALVTSAILAISAGAVVAGAELITEPAGALLLLLAVACLAHALTSKPWGPPVRRRLIAGGLLLGGGILVRPDFLVLAPTVAAVLLVAGPWTRRVRLRAGVTFLLAAGAAVAPWSLAASTWAGQLVLPTTSGASSFWVGTYLPADGSTHRARALLAADVHRRFPDTYKKPSPPAVDMMRTVAERRPTLRPNQAVQQETLANLRTYALGHPAAFTRMQLGKVWRMWNRPYQGHNRMRSWLTIALHVPAALAALVAIVGAGMLRRRNAPLLLVAAVLLAGTAFNALAAVQPRANVRFIPIALLGAAMAATAVRDLARSR